MGNKKNSRNNAIYIGYVSCFLCFLKKLSPCKKKINREKL